MKTLLGWIGTILFWGFIAVKVWGTTFAAWSWWWLLLTIVPWAWFLFVHLGKM